MKTLCTLYFILLITRFLCRNSTEKTYTKETNQQKIVTSIRIGEGEASKKKYGKAATCSICFQSNAYL